MAMVMLTLTNDDVGAEDCHEYVDYGGVDDVSDVGGNDDDVEDEDWHQYVDDDDGDDVVVGKGDVADHDDDVEDEDCHEQIGDDVGSVSIRVYGYDCILGRG